MRVCVAVSNVLEHSVIIILVLAEGAHGGVIVIQEWWGVDNETVVKAEKLANAGFAVLVSDRSPMQCEAHRH